MKNQLRLGSINSISELHHWLKLPKPQHPLISVISFENIKESQSPNYERIVYNFYMICIKKGFEGKLKYGQNYYDFDEGIMSYISPGQVLTSDATSPKGWLLIFHPDFIQNYSLVKKIKNYSFFSYELNEALHLSEKEEMMVENIFQNIKSEYQSNIDHFSQDVMVSQIELLLNYSNRFYNRQFITRKAVNDEILVRLENLLSEYFENKNTLESGLPTVHYISEQLHVSPDYLSDMLRSMTGQSTQQHIHAKLIEKAKELLTTTSMPVHEIAYLLGFEYPQSLNKIFKKKMRVTPLEYRKSFN